jgi:hypothetical protein
LAHLNFPFYPYNMIEDILIKEIEGE